MNAPHTQLSYEILCDNKKDVAVCSINPQARQGPQDSHMDQSGNHWCMGTGSQAEKTFRTMTEEKSRAKKLTGKEKEKKKEKEENRKQTGKKIKILPFM